MLRSSRRKSIAQQGITKTAVSASSQAERRATLGGVIGERLIVPGSSATSLTELLQEVELSLDQSARVAPKLPPCDDPFMSPSPMASAVTHTSPGSLCATREWTREDWKLLDTCFTEERLEMGDRLGLENEGLADPSDIRSEDIVKRFICKMGGTEIMDKLGSAWTW